MARDSILIIRSGSMETFRQESKRRFQSRLSALMQPSADRLSVPVEELARQVLDDCSEYGIHRECDIAAYAQYVNAAGNRPLTKADQNILLAHGVPGEQKIRALQAHGAATAPADFSSLPPGTVVVPCQSQSPQSPTYFVEIELVDETDQPVPWEEYRIQLPDGKIAKGYLDQSGWARINNISAAGNCRVSFPNLDREAWAVHSASPLPPLGGAS